MHEKVLQIAVRTCTGAGLCSWANLHLSGGPSIAPLAGVDSYFAFFLREGTTKGTRSEAKYSRFSKGNATCNE